MLFYLLFFGGYALLALLFFQFVSRHLLTRPEILQFLSRWPDYAESLIAVLTLIPLAFFLILYFRFLFGFFMRNFERQADLYALELVGSPEPLIGSLEKIAIYSGQDRRLPSWHHFSIAERVEFLEQSSREPRLIARHRRKVRSSVAVYLVLLAALGLYGWRSPDLFLAQGTSEAQILEQMLQKELRAHPDDPRILAGLGLVYQQQDKHREAEAAYQKVLKLEPRNALVINNLAWMYATSRDPQFRKPREALALAQEAAMLKPDPVVLDTLAEAYLVNDRPDLALRTADKILERDPDNRDYFERQRERFQKALEKQGSEKGLPKVAI